MGIPFVESSLDRALWYSRIVFGEDGNRQMTIGVGRYLKVDAKKIAIPRSYYPPLGIR